MGHRDSPEGVCLVLCSWWLIVQLAPPWPRVSHICTSLTKNSLSQAESILFRRFSDGCWFRYLAEERASHFKVCTSFFPALEIMTASVSCSDLCLVMTSSSSVSSRAGQLGELVHTTLHLSDFHNFFRHQSQWVQARWTETGCCGKRCCAVPDCSIGSAQRTVQLYRGDHVTCTNWER